MFKDYRGHSEPTAAPDFRETYLDEIITTIQDEAFVASSRSKDGRQGFTRNRKIPFLHLIVLLTQGLSRSLQRELNSFYQRLQNSEFALQHVTKGAFSRARAKLRAEAFVKLNEVGINSFYRHAPYRRFQGFRLLGIDGSTAVLPRHKTIEQEFGTTCFGPYADSPRSVARTSVLYDLLNLTVVDGQIDRYEVSERELARRHLPLVAPHQDLLVFDRGYPSLALMFEMQQLGIDYLIRMQEGWWLEVRKLLREGERDKEVIFQLSASEKHLLEQYGTQDPTIRCRLVAVPLPNGSTEVLCTSVVDRGVLPWECFGELYHYRWNIEEGYKLFKSRLQLEAFSGKTALAIRQDFFAKLFMMTTTAVLAFPVEEKLKQEQQQPKSKRKHPHQINRTNALALVKEMALKVFVQARIRPALQVLDKILRATTELVRSNRKFPRKKLKKKPPSMNYKQL